MKITKMLTSSYFFFFNRKENLALCKPFVKVLTGQDTELFNICRVAFSTKDQKEKGYRKIVWNDPDCVSFKKRKFVLCISEREFLENAGLKVGDCFWAKIELT